MWIFGAIFKNPEDSAHLLKLKVASVVANRAIPSDPNLAFCYQVLGRVNRGFSVVLQQLNPNLRNAVCVFYVVVRGLEAIEDDMTIAYDAKVELLRGFHKKMFDPMFHYPYGNEEYTPLMDKFHLISNALIGLSVGYQEVISEIVQRMGEGMVKYLTAQVDSLADYNEYCHFTAGLMGLGLTRLFYTAGVEQFTPDYLSNSMGLFLQKTNVIRDYLEQINSEPKPKRRWPREIWVKYADKLEDFKDETHYKEAVQCLNEMVTDALSHGVDCLQYMASLQDPANLRFCAIPQEHYPRIEDNLRGMVLAEAVILASRITSTLRTTITALGTLAMCYNNTEVFRSSVRLRRGLTAKILDVKTMPDVYGAFFDFTSLLDAKIEKTDPNTVNTHKCVEEIRSICKFEIRNRKAFTIESKVGHETCLVLALCILLVVMLVIVSL